jgi:PKHD-type hydroxylase
MLHCLTAVLTPEEIRAIRDVLATAEWVDGKTTAGFRARRVKENEQLRKGDEVREVDNIVLEALRRHGGFGAAVVPNRIHSPLFSRYRPGMHYGPHIDDAMMNKRSPLRADVAVTVFLGEPADYDGGELVIHTNFGPQEIKLPAGDAVIYPASSLHHVAAVTRGERFAAVTWVQSYVRDPARREVLHDLLAIRKLLSTKMPDAPETELAFKTYSNLLRMWVET